MVLMFNRHRTRIVAAMSALTLALGLASCSDSSDDSKGGSSGKLKVAASFYPIQWLTQQIGGDHVDVSSVTPAGTEPHEFEIGTKQIAELNKTKALFYVKGFQPSLDDAVGSLSDVSAVDLTKNVNLVHHEGLLEHDHDHGDKDHGDKKDGEAKKDDGEKGHEDGKEHDHAEGRGDDAADPHFWLDSARMKRAADAIAAELSKKDPGHADAYKKNNEALQKKLDGLDKSFQTGLATCERRSIVTTHTAFGYLADRYKLSQVGLSGIDPESEPSPATLAKVKKYVQENGTTTIFTEELVSGKPAETLAKETKTVTAVLSPLESKPEKGDYEAAMTGNLTALKKALACK